MILALTIPTHLPRLPLLRSGRFSPLEKETFPKDNQSAKCEISISAGFDILTHRYVCASAFAFRIRGVVDLFTGDQIFMPRKIRKRFESYPGSFRTAPIVTRIDLETFLSAFSASGLVVMMIPTHLLPPKQKTTSLSTHRLKCLPRSGTGTFDHPRHDLE